MIYGAHAKHSVRRFLMAGAATIAVTSGAHAQTAANSVVNNSTIETVVVTSERRGDQNTIDVPMAVDAISGSTLKDFNINSMTDLTKLDPSLTVVNYGATQQRIVIRGISSTTTATTGVYLDEAPLLGPFNGNIQGDGTPSLRLHDVEHVEVLKGPQGTLFGASSMDGTLRVVTVKPDLENVAAYADLTGAGVDGGDGLFNGDLTVNLPVIQDKVGLRVTGWTEQGGGYINKTITATGTTTSHANDTNLVGARASLRLEPIDNLTIDTSLNYQAVNVPGPQYATPRVGLTAATALARPVGANAYTNYDPTQDYDREGYKLLSANADYDLGFGDAIASGSLGRKSLLDASDTSGTACGLKLCAGSAFGYPAVFTRNVYYTDHTGELRFSSKFDGPLQLVTGAYYEDTNQNYNGAALQTSLTTGLPPCETFVSCSSKGLINPGVGASPVIFANADQFNTVQYAIFGQVDYQIIPELTATLGGRYFSAHITDVATNQESISPDYLKGVVTVPSSAAQLNTTQTKPTFNASLMYKPSDDWSVYVRAASGFRIGGINNNASVAAQAGTTIPASYRPDSLWDYEIGTKLFMLDRTLSVDASYYHIDWKGQQLNATAGGTFSYQLNAGLTQTNGVELNATYKPIAGLTLGGSVTYVDSRLAQNLPQDAITAGTYGTSGDRVPYQPEWTFAGHGEYDIPLNTDATAYVQSDLNFRGSSYTAFANPPTPTSKANYNTYIPDYYLLNARTGMRFDKYDVSIFVQNITNEVAVLGTAVTVNSTRQYLATPRTVGVTLSANL